MIRWVILLLILSVVAGLLGFTGISVAFMDVARILFYIFIVLFVLALISYVVTGRKPPPPL